MARKLHNLLIEERPNAFQRRWPCSCGRPSPEMASVEDYDLVSRVEQSAERVLRGPAIMPVDGGFEGIRGVSTPPRRIAEERPRSQIGANPASKKRNTRVNGHRAGSAHPQKKLRP